MYLWERNNNKKVDQLTCLGSLLRKDGHRANDTGSRIAVGKSAFTSKLNLQLWNGSET